MPALHVNQICKQVSIQFQTRSDGILLDLHDTWAAIKRLRHRCSLPTIHWLVAFCFGVLFSTLSSSSQNFFALAVHSLTGFLLVFRY